MIVSKTRIHFILTEEREFHATEEAAREATAQRAGIPVESVAEVATETLS